MPDAEGVARLQQLTKSAELSSHRENLLEQLLSVELLQACWLRGLPLTDPEVRNQLGVSPEELVSDDLRRCQDLAVEAREAGFEGILAPSAAPEGEITLAVFSTAIDKMKAEHSRVQRPPIRMLRVLEGIRLPEAVVDSVGRLYESLVTLGRRVRNR